MPGEEPRPAPRHAQRLLDLVEGVSAELLEQRVRDRQRHHRLAHHRRGRDGAGVAPLDVGSVGSARRQIHAAQRRGYRGDRFHRRPGDERLAVGHAALEPPGVIRLAHDGSACAIHRIVHARSWIGRCAPAVAQLDRFDGGNRGKGAREQSVEAEVVLRVAAQPGRQAGHAHLEGTAHGVALLLCPLDLHAERFAVGRVQRAHAGAVGAQRQLVGILLGELPELADQLPAGAGLPDRGDERSHPDVQLVQQPPHGRGERDAHRRLARAGALQRVAQIPVAELDGAGQIGVSRARQRHLAARIVRWLDRHARGPGLEMVGVLDQHRDRAAQRAPVPDAGEDARHLRLDLHAPAAPVAELAPLQIALEVCGEQRNPRRHPVEDPDQRGPVRFPRGEEAQPGHASAASRSAGASSSSCGRESQISRDAMAWCTSTSMPSTARKPRSRAARTRAVVPAGPR